MHSSITVAVLLLALLGAQVNGQSYITVGGHRLNQIGRPRFGSLLGLRGGCIPPYCARRRFGNQGFGNQRFRYYCHSVWGCQRGSRTPIFY